jgi:hypothetical protein
MNDKGVRPTLRRAIGTVCVNLAVSAKMRNVASGNDHQKPQIRTYD